MAEDPKAGSGINYQVDSFNARKKAERAKEKAKSKAKEKSRVGLVKGKISNNEKKQSIYAGPEIPMLKTKKAQTLATSADKPKEIIQRKNNSGPNTLEKVYYTKKAPLKDVISHALNKASIAAKKKMNSIKNSKS